MRQVGPSRLVARLCLLLIWAPAAVAVGGPQIFDQPLAVAALPPPLSVLAVVGVFSGVGPKYAERRAVLRSTWFPATAAEQQRLRATASIDVRFAVGQPSNATEVAGIASEESRFGAFWRLDVLEEYGNLSLKVRGQTLASWGMDGVSKMYTNAPKPYTPSKRTPHISPDRVWLMLRDQHID